MLIIWLSVVLAFSVIPVPETGIERKDIDKLSHFMIYGITALIFGRSLYKSQRGLLKIGLLSVVFSGLYGIIMEIFQLFLPYRSFSLGDILFNFLGASFFVSVWIMVLEKGCCR